MGNKKRLSPFLARNHSPTRLRKCMPNKVLEGCQWGSAVPRTVLAPLNGGRGEYPACIINFLTIDKRSLSRAPKKNP
jgi:hypothetical protein